MLVFPAVDVKDGRCVRLQKGDPDAEKVYELEPWKAAQRWADEGARALHVVDLDGALGTRNNRAEIEELLQKVSLPVEIGGGLRSEDAIRDMLDAGAARAVVGTRAVEEPDWAIELTEMFRDSIVVALDARDGLVAVEGWQKTSDVEATELARRLAEGEPAAFLYTDVSRDGMLSHPNFDAVAEMVQATNVPVIASGGVSSDDDIRRLGEAGADAVIVGKALYEGRLTLSDAMQAAEPFEGGLSARPRDKDTSVS
ncbi:MAG: 1-(5-phosphoribosyl)-5-[(5-phosphoribosylamino)methylideneamino]imidazole-4-carboxamide isomerase [Planctomycetota bacterium]